MSFANQHIDDFKWRFPVSSVGIKCRKAIYRWIVVSGALPPKRRLLVRYSQMISWGHDAGMDKSSL